MPHRVVNFFRSSTHSLENEVSSLAKKTTKKSTSRRRRYSPDRIAKGSGSSGRASSTLISDDSSSDTAAPPYSPRMKMADSRASSFSSDSHKEHGHNHHHHHRLSFPGMHFGRSNKDTQHSSPATLDWKLESPPLVMYGDPATSSGTLLSGQLFLNIKEDGLEIESLDATLSIHVTQKKPFANHCAECTNQYTELKRWELLQHPLAMAKGRAWLFSFPFVVEIGG